jgi:pimeloyl-ACP methyl ester carboxylesterase
MAIPVLGIPRMVAMLSRQPLTTTGQGGSVPDEMASPAGIAVVAHGGHEVSTQPSSSLQLSVLRMIPVARAIRFAVQGSGIVVSRPRFRVRGWNGDQASPVGDLTLLLDDIHGRLGDVPVIVVGHSMGARAAMRVAGHPAVSAVAGLAPWLPPGEPVTQLAGRRVLLVHGSADSITPPADTWAYAGRARDVTSISVIEVSRGDHPMIRRAPLWHAIAAEFARLCFGLPAGPGPAGVAVRTATEVLEARRLTV